MRLQKVSKASKQEHPCPICCTETTLSEIAPHPLHVNFEVRGYVCEQCGPVKSLVVLRSPLHA